MSKKTASQFLKREDSIAYYILGSDHRDSALAVCARSFMREPTSVAFSELKPEMKIKFIDWVELIDFFMDDCCTNGLSIIAIDENNHRLVSAYLVRDMSFLPQGYFNKYQSPNVALSALIQMIFYIDEEAIKCCPELKKTETPGYGADLWMLGVAPDYAKNNMAQKMLDCALLVAKSKGFKIVISETTGDYSARLIRKNDFSEITKFSAKEFVWNGEKVFQLVKPPHGIWRYWIKDLNKILLQKSKL